MSVHVWTCAALTINSKSHICHLPWPTAIKECMHHLWKVIAKTNLHLTSIRTNYKSSIAFLCSLGWPTVCLTLCPDFCLSPELNLISRLTACCVISVKPGAMIHMIVYMTFPRLAVPTAMKLIFHCCLCLFAVDFKKLWLTQVTGCCLSFPY